MKMQNISDKGFESIFTLKNAEKYMMSDDKYECIIEFLKTAEIEYDENEIDEQIMMMTENVFESILNYN